MKKFLLSDYRIVGIVLVLTLCLGMNAFALDGFVEGEKIETSKYIADTIWVLVAAFLVFSMVSRSGVYPCEKRRQYPDEKPNGFLDGIYCLLGNRIRNYVW